MTVVKTMPMPAMETYTMYIGVTPPQCKIWELSVAGDVIYTNCNVPDCPMTFTWNKTTIGTKVVTFTAESIGSASPNTFTTTLDIINCP